VEVVVVVEVLTNQYKSPLLRIIQVINPQQTAATGIIIIVTIIIIMIS